MVVVVLPAVVAEAAAVAAAAADAAVAAYAASRRGLRRGRLDEHVVNGMALRVMPWACWTRLCSDLRGTLV